MNTQHIIQLLQQALQELQQQPTQQPMAQTPQQPMATAPAPVPAAATTDPGSRWITGEVGSHNGSVFDTDPNGQFKLSAKGQIMTGFYLKLDGGGGCFVKAFDEACATLSQASITGYTDDDPPKPIYGPGVRFKAYLNITPAPGKRNPYRDVSQIQLLEKVVQF